VALGACVYGPYYAQSVSATTAWLGQQGLQELAAGNPSCKHLLGLCVAADAYTIPRLCQAIPTLAIGRAYDDVHCGPGWRLTAVSTCACRYEMFTCYLGKGDKETFAYAFMAVGEPYTLISTPPRAIGTTGMCLLCWHACNLPYTVLLSHIITTAHCWFIKH
jgi:hypothetical protein